jgi:DNA-binding response OmpR family regulator
MVQVGIMNNLFTILILDRNRHVREFLRREFTEAGFRAHVAKDGQEVLMIVDRGKPPDLLILDLEIPHGDGLQVLERLQGRVPPLPVVVHSFLAEHTNQPGLELAAALVEKRADPDCLKATVIEVLRKYYPERFFPYGCTTAVDSGLGVPGSGESGD